MNDYTVEMPLWCEEDVVNWLSGRVRRDLMDFAARWDAAVDPEILDDRWDHAPRIRRLVELRYALGRRLPSWRPREAAAEDQEMRRLGETLASRVQHELGPRYRVTYQH